MGITLSENERDDVNKWDIAVIFCAGHNVGACIFRPEPISWFDWIILIGGLIVLGSYLIEAILTRTKTIP